MKFTVNNAVFVKGMQPAMLCASTSVKREYPDAGKISISVTKKEMTVFANNGNVALTAIVPEDKLNYVCDSIGTATVRAVDFEKTLSSFRPAEDLNFSVDGSELVIQAGNDPEDSQRIPFDAKGVDMPETVSTFDKEVRIKRDLFASAMNKVFYAIGAEQFRPEFLYWLLRVRKDTLRTVCGCGSRFVVYQITGANIGPKKDLDVVIPKDHTPLLEKVIPLGGEDEIIIQEYKHSGGTDSLSSQTVIKTGLATMVLIGHDPGIKWPNEDKFLTRKNKVKIVISAKDLTLPLAGAEATYNEDVRKSNQHHYTFITVDFEKKIGLIKSSHVMKSVRKVPILDSDVEDGTKSLTFCCLTKYLVEMHKHCAADGNIQLEFSSEKEPAVARYFADAKVKNGELKNVNSAAGTEEECTTFFASFNKK